MLRSIPMAALVAPFLMMCTPAAAQCEFHGIVTSDYVTYCSDVTHRIVDPCSGFYTFMSSSLLDLRQYACANVRVQGPPKPDIECSGCENIDVTEVVPEPPACVLQIPSLEVTGGASCRITWLRWLACIDRYDIIRGNVANLRQAGPNVDLGPVVCVANDWTSSQYVQDGTAPLAGEGFFYLVRGQGGLGTTTYGVSSSGADEIPSAGDCP